MRLVSLRLVVPMAAALLLCCSCGHLWSVCGQASNKSSESMNAERVQDLLPPPSNATTARPSRQSAPYDQDIADNVANDVNQPNVVVGSGGSGSTPATSDSATKNLVFRLTLNQTARSEIERTGTSDQDPWTFMSQNGTILGQRASLDLRKLLDTLNSNNFTSEVAMDDYNPDIVNITISNGGQHRAPGGGAAELAAADASFLEELLVESRSPKGGGGGGSDGNSSSVVKDNHRFISKYPARSKTSTTTTTSISALAGGRDLQQANQQQQQQSTQTLVMMPPPPPLRRTVDLMADNYTMRKVADEANVFALRLFNQLNIEKLGRHNVIQSPFVVYDGLALLLAGSMGDTSRELDRLLLGSQSAYENTKLTHDQDRARLMASFNDVVRQLRQGATSHFHQATSTMFPPAGNLQLVCNNSAPFSLDCAAAQTNRQQLVDASSGGGGGGGGPDTSLYRGGSEGQHLIAANNLLFSASAHEISPEFRATLGAYYNNTALTRIETGSTESIQTINGWIRRTTAGLIPAIIHKRATFDEFNVLTLLATSWLAQQWRDNFERISSSLRSSIRLKGQTVAMLPRAVGRRSGDMGVSQSSGASSRSPSGRRSARQEGDEPLMEFVDDNQVSHFVDYLRSEVTRNIHHYHSVLNGQLVDVIVVPFADSNQRMVVISPLIINNQLGGQQAAAAAAAASQGNFSDAQSPQQQQQQQQYQQADADQDPTPAALGNPNGQAPAAAVEPTDSSPLTKLIAHLAGNPRKALRALWQTIAPDIITRRLYQNRQQASLNSSAKEDQAPATSSIPPRVRLSMPIIRAEADTSLSASLNHIGLVNAFDPSQANFIGINGHPFNYYKLHLSNVIYKTTFNVNELGVNYDRTVKSLESMRISPPATAAAAAASAQRHRKGRPGVVVHLGTTKTSGEQQQQQQDDELIDEIKLDKPFVYLICDVKMKLVLYTGIVRNPAQGAV